MKKSTKKIAIALSVFMCLQPVMFAVDSDLNKDIVALELELHNWKLQRLQKPSPQKILPCKACR